MAPGTHVLVSWWTANVWPLSRRDRFLVFISGIILDLDGIGLLVGQEAYFRYHHVVLHNLLACVVWAVIAACLAQRRWLVAVLAAVNWHLHLACDYFGSRGPWDTPPWVLPYLYPFVGTLTEREFLGPAWYWNPWQWPLDAWPNTLTTVMFLIGAVYIAVRLDRTWFEFVSLRFDHELCKMLRKWFGGQVSNDWSPREGTFIRGSFVLLVTLAMLSCVIAGILIHNGAA
jgi:hypothetical protein